MKKIGILTFHRSINNGAVLQCYSLLKKLQKDFPLHSFEVVDFNMRKTETMYPVTLKQYLSGYKGVVSKIKGFIAFLLDPLRLKRNRIKKTVFYESLSNLDLSEEQIYTNDASKLFKYVDSKYDVVIAGSDVIWNYEVRGFPNPYFLHKDSKPIKMSYAASCNGMNYEKIPIQEKDIIKDIFNTYGFVGVRDSESELFFNSLSCQKKCYHNCDPTLLLDVRTLPVDEKSLRDKMSKMGFKFDKKTIAVIGNNDVCKFIKKIYHKEYQIVSLFNYSKYADVNLIYLNPFEWAFSFKYYSIVFSTYFHGTIFGLKNAVPTFCFSFDTDFNKKHISKVQDLLHRINLEDHFFSFDSVSRNPDSFASAISKMVQRGIDYEHLFDSEVESYFVFKEALSEILKKC